MFVHKITLKRLRSEKPDRKGKLWKQKESVNRRRQPGANVRRRQPGANVRRRNARPVRQKNGQSVSKLHENKLHANKLLVRKLLGKNAKQKKWLARNVNKKLGN